MVYFLIYCNGYIFDFVFIKECEMLFYVIDFVLIDLCLFDYFVVMFKFFCIKKCYFM